MSLVILDRDGVINHDSDNYIRTLEDWVPIPGSIDAIASLSRAGYSVAIATNQSGLGRNYFTLETLEAIHARLSRLVSENGGEIAGIFYCPHLPDTGCVCRKPATGLITTIEQELGMSARHAPFIGDSLKDLQAAQAAGCKPILVRTGKGEDTLVTINSDNPGIDDAQKIAVYADLSEACQAILAGGQAGH